MRRFVALAAVTVLLVPAVVLGETWDFTSSFLTESTPGFYSQAAWSPWNAGYVADGGSFVPYDSYHIDTHGAWFMDPGNSGYGPDKQGAVCKNISTTPFQSDCGGGTFFYEEVGQTVLLTGYDGPNLTAVHWTAPATGTYCVSAIFTGQKYSYLSDMLTDAAVLNGSTSLYSGTLTGFFGTAANNHTDATPDATTSLSYLSAPISLLAGDVLSFQINGHGGLHWAGLQATVTAIPEPCTTVLVTTSLLGILAYAWRKQKQ